MKKNFKKTLVAMLVLFAMLTQNTASVLAVAVSEQPEIVVEHVDGIDASESNVESETEIIQEDMSSTEITAETPADEPQSSDDQVEIVDESTQESGDDIITPLEEDTQTEEPADAEIPEDAETPSEDESVIAIPALDGDEEETPSEEITEEPATDPNLSVLDNQISGVNLESVEVYVDTTALSNKDTFRIIFTGPDEAKYNTVLNDNLDATAQGYYAFENLNNEGFNIHCTAGKDVTFDYSLGSDGKPVIKVRSLSTAEDKILYSKTITTNDGSPIAALFGTGYENVIVNIDNKDFDEGTTYTVYVDTEADVAINGENTKSIQGSVDLAKVEITNIDNADFTVYAIADDGFTISSEIADIDDVNATVDFTIVGSKVNNKREYTYADSNVSVVATCEYASAVPDDAIFRVTPITEGAIYDAYMEALIKKSEEDGTAITEENTLLYDIAFLLPKKDEDGNVIEDEFVEIEPEVGSVDIDIKFKKSQLSDEIGATDAEEITVTHLPISEEAKANADTTLDADITADDINVEPVEADVEVNENGVDEVSLTLDSFSVVAVTKSNKEVETLTPGTTTNIDSILGRAKNYGLVANNINIVGHLETNFATKNLTSSTTFQGPRNGNGYGGDILIGDANGGKFQIGTNHNTGGITVYATNEVMNHIVKTESGASNWTNLSNEKLKENETYKQIFNQSDRKGWIAGDVTIDWETYTKEDISTRVDSMLSYVRSKSNSLYNENSDNQFRFSEFNNNIDLTSYDNGRDYQTFYIYVTDNDWGNSYTVPGYWDSEKNEWVPEHEEKANGTRVNPKFTLKLTSRQNVVFNVSYSNVGFAQYTGVLDGKEITTSGDYAEDALSQHVIFNCPNATKAQTCGPTSGVFVIPNENAHFDTNSVAAGWLVTPNIDKVGGQEWHCIFHELKRDSFSLGVSKELVGVTSDEDKAMEFTFDLYNATNSSFDLSTATKKESVTIKGGESTLFSRVEVTEAGTHYYIIKESSPNGWTALRGPEAHVTVVVDDNLNTTASYTIDKAANTEYTNSGTMPSGGYINFVNTKPEEELIGTELNLGVNKTLRNIQYENQRTDVEFILYKTDEKLYSYPNNIISTLTVSANEFSKVEGRTDAYSTTKLFEDKITIPVDDKDKNEWKSKANGSSKYYYYVINEKVLNDDGTWYVSNYDWAHVRVTAVKNNNAITVSEVKYVYGPFNGWSEKDRKNAFNDNYDGNKHTKYNCETSNPIIPFINVKHGKDDYFQFTVQKYLYNSSYESGAEWPTGAKFAFKIEPLDSNNKGDANQVSNRDASGAPALVLENGLKKLDNNNYYVIVDSPEDIITIKSVDIPYDSSDNGVINGSYKRTDQWYLSADKRDGAIAYPRCYMYKVSEILPNTDDWKKVNALEPGALTKIDGVEYTGRLVTESGEISESNVQYIKVWHDSVKLNNLEWVEIHVNGSKNLLQCEDELPPIKFSNTYEEPKGSLIVTKTTDIAPAGKKFYFTASKTDNETTVYLEKDGKSVIEIPANGSVSFNDLKIGDVYTITEVNQDGTALGEGFPYEVSYAPSNGVSAPIAINGPVTVGITNTYTGTAKTSFHGLKNAEAGTTAVGLAAGDFTFKLVPVSANAPMPTTSSEGYAVYSDDTHKGYLSSENAYYTTNNASTETTSGIATTFEFPEITFTKANLGAGNTAKTYEYKIIEDNTKQNSTLSTVLNTEEYRVFVIVSIDDNGVLSVSNPTYKKYANGTYSDSSDALFTNEVSGSVSVNFVATKTMNGRTLRAGEFTFVLEAMDSDTVSKNSVIMPAADTDKDGIIEITNTATDFDDVINFGSVSYSLSDIGKSFKYRITERATNANVSGNGVEYDSHVYEITVTPELDASYTMYIDETIAGSYYTSATKTFTVPFTNSYTERGQVVFSVDKALTANVPELYRGKDNAESTFTFVLEEKGTNNDYSVIQTKPVHGAGTVNFDVVSYNSTDANTTKYYRIRELSPLSGSDVEEVEIAGKKYSAKKISINGSEVYYGLLYNVDPIYFTVSVNGTGNGTFNTVIKDASGNVIKAADATTYPVIGTITNDYKFRGTEITLEGEKKVNGKADDVISGKFAFTLSAASATDASDNPIALADIPMPVGAVSGSVSVNNGNTSGVNKFSFGTISYNSAGTYRYVVTENNPEDDEIGWDRSIYDVEVSVTDNGHKGALVATKRITKRNGSGSSIIFDNFKQNGSAIIKAHKSIKSNKVSVNAGEFTFGLYTKNSNDEYVAFNKVNGTQYTATNDANGNVVFDAIPYKYTDLTNNELNVTYYVHEIVGTAVNGYSYDDGYYPVDVHVAYNGEGSDLSVTYKAGNDTEYKVYADYATVEIENEFNALGKAQINVIKNLLGGKIDKDDNFTFKLEPYGNTGNATSNGKDTQVITISGRTWFSKSTESKSFEVMEYTTPGIYTYKVYEYVDTNSSSVSDNDTEVMYDDSYYIVTIKMNYPTTKVAGSNANAEMVKTISYQKYNSKGEPIGNSVSGTESNSIAALDVSFENKIYNGGVFLTVYKELTGKDLADGDFTFILKDLDTNEVIQSDATNVAKVVNFNEITYGTADIGTHYYEISEELPTVNGATVVSKNGIKYDDKKIYARVEVSPSTDTNKKTSLNSVVTYWKNYSVDNNGNKTVSNDITSSKADITFNNEYTGNTSIVITGEKELYAKFEDEKYSKKLPVGTHVFRFELRDSKDNIIMQQSKNVSTDTVTYQESNADGTFAFDEIKYDQTVMAEGNYDVKTEDGKYIKYYYINEVRVSSNNAITYDDKQYVVEVKIYVDNNGELTHDDPVIYDGGTGLKEKGSFKAWLDKKVFNKADVVFKNVYNPTGEVVLSVTKDLKGVSWDNENAKFEFTLTEKSSNFIADAIHGFISLFKEDSSAQTITISKNSANYTESFDKIVIESANLTGKDDDGHRYGEFVYELVEKTQSGIPGLRYDKTKYTVTITATDTEDGSGKLDIKTVITNDSNDIARPTVSANGVVSGNTVICQPESQIFKNIYSPTPSEDPVVIEGDKELNGATLTAGAFEFEITKASGNNGPLPNPSKVSNNEAGHFEFGALTFNRDHMVVAGSTSGNEVYVRERDFVYYVNEIEPAEHDQMLVYDTVPYEVVVRVTTTENKDGNPILKASINSIKRINSDSNTSIKFSNEYYNGSDAEFKVKKTISGINGTTDTKFNFLLTGKDENGNAVSMNASNVSANGAEHLFKDSAGNSLIHYTADKTINNAKENGTVSGNVYTVVYDFDITEDRTGTVGDDEVGLYYSKETYTARVTVVANKDGNTCNSKVEYIKKTDSDGSDVTTETPTSQALFTNTYTSKGSISVNGTKTLKGRDMKSGEKFTFNLYGESDPDEVLDTIELEGKKENEVAGFTFPSDASKTYFDYTQNDLGNHYYIIEEVQGTEASLVYDSNSYLVKVTVSEKKNDNKKELYNGELDVKSLVVRIPRGNKTRSEYIDDNKSAFDTIDGVTRTSADINFVNKYSATGSWRPVGYKTVIKGDQFEAPTRTFNFKLEELDKDGKAISGHSCDVTNNGNSITFPADKTSFLEYKLEFNEDGSVKTDDRGIHTYRITETSEDGNGYTCDKSVYTFTVNVSDNGLGELKPIVETAVEAKRPTSAQIPSDLTTKINNNEVQFYYINKYTASRSIYFDAAKELIGREMTDSDKFEFVITEVTAGAKKEGQSVTVYNDKGIVNFGTADSPLALLTYDETEASVGGTKHYYLISENTPKDKTITRVGNPVYRVTVEAKDNQNGIISAKIINVEIQKEGGAFEPLEDINSTQDVTFTNKYDASAQLKLTGTKNLKHSETANVNLPDASGFTMALYSFDTADRSGKETLVDAKETAKDGSFSFDTIEYSVAETLKTVSNNYVNSKTFYYRVLEKKPTSGTWDKDHKNFTSAGVTYDNNYYDIDVTVAQNGTDKLSVTIKDKDGKDLVPVTGTDNTYSVGGFTFTNIKPQSISINGTKTWHDDLGNTPEKRPEITINLRWSVDNFASVYKTTKITAPATTYSFTDLPVLDDNGKEISYKVDEVKVPGYETEQNGYNFTNTKGQIQIRKVDEETGVSLPDAELQILKDGKVIESWTSTDSAHVVEATLEVGKYTLHEVKAPAGYDLAEDMTFDVTSLKDEILVTMKDPKIKGSVSLHKVDADTRERLIGAEFSLYKEDGTPVYAMGSSGNYKYSESTSNARLVVNGSGVINVTELPAGTYYFKEIQAPAGYELSTEKLSFTIIKSNETVEVTMTNKKEVGSVRLRKTNADGSRTLAGAVFELYAKTPSSLSSAIASTIFADAYYRVGTYTTDASGVIYVKDLPWDDYYFIETKAPAGYQINRDTNGDPIVYTFKIGSGSSAEVTVDLGTIRNSIIPPDEPTPPTPTTPSPTPTPETPRATVLGERSTPTTPAVDDGRRSGGVLAGVLGVRAAPRQGVLGERVGPATGDTANIILWMLLLVACISAIVGVLVVGKKKDKRRARKVS